MEERAEGVERLRRPAQPLAERGRPHRDDHELLEIGRVDGVLAAVEDVDKGHRQGTGAGPAEVAVQRQAE